MQGDKIIRTQMNRDGTTFLWINNDMIIQPAPSGVPDDINWDAREERIAKLDLECRRANDAWASLKIENTR